LSRTQANRVSFPAVVVVPNQYPTLIGPTRLGGLEHSEDFTADRHRRVAESLGPGSIPLGCCSLSLGGHSAPSLERLRERVVRIRRQIGVERL